MRKVFTFLFALCMTVFANAQKTVADFGWNEGDDVTADLGVKAADSGENDGEPKDGTCTGASWIGFDYTQSTKKNDQDYPKYEYLSYDYHTWGIYGISNWDVYQTVENVPAGVYTLTVEGLYRGGQLAAVINQFEAGNPIKNTKLYVKVGEDVYEVYFKDICEGRFAGQDDGSGNIVGLYTAADGAWGSDTKTGDWFYPVSHGGFSASIDYKGAYPDEEGFLGSFSHYHNAVQFVVPEDGTTIQIGAKHEKNISEDSSAWDHWRIFFDYEYDDDGKLKVAEAKFYDALEAIRTWQEDKASDYPAFSTMLNDAIMEVENDVTPDVDSYNNAIKKLDQIEETFKTALITINSMNYLIGVTESLIESRLNEENPRYADCNVTELERALDEAKTAIGADTDIIESLDDYILAANALYKARVDYVMSSPSKPGKDGDTMWKDISGVVACSGLVNEQYTPFYNAEGQYVYPKEIEESWFLYHPNDNCNTEILTGYINDRIKAEDYPQFVGMNLPLLADEAHYSFDVTDVNRWIYDGTSFTGAITSAVTSLQWLKGYSAYYTGNTAQPLPGELLFYQTIPYLPEGYYSVEGRMINSKGYSVTSDAEPINQFIFIKGVADDGTVGEESKVNNPDETNWGSYTREDWTIVESDMIYLHEGENLVIGYSQNCQGGDGGVILKAFGTDVDFKGLTAAAKEKTVANFEAKKGNFKMNADESNVQALLDQVVPESVEDDPGMKAAKAILAEADLYINEAAAYTPTAIDTYSELIETYTSENEKTILNAAKTFAQGEIDKPTATYKDGQVLDAQAKAYATYIKVFDQAEKLGGTEINGILSAQVADLATYCSDEQTLIDYAVELGAPIKKAIFAQLGTDEATEENPVDVTVVVNNPSLTDSPSNGWTCDNDTPERDSYARHSARKWQANADINVHQEIQYLPAGKYKVTVRAAYRDAADNNVAYENFFTTAGGDYENWASTAEFYAKTGKEVAVKVKSVVDPSGAWDAPSYTKWYNMNGKEDEYTEAEGFIKNSWEGSILPVYEDEIKDPSDPDLPTYEVNIDNPEVDGSGTAVPNCFDTEIEGKFYLGSTHGFDLRVAKDDVAFNNEINIDLKKGENLVFGLRRGEQISGDCLYWDEFRLYYCGPLDETTPEPNPSVNYITDENSYNFNKGTFGNWTMSPWNNNGGKATAAVVEPGYNKSAYALALTNTEANTEFYQGQFSYNLDETHHLLVGKSYRLQFYAKATEGTTGELQMSAEAPYEWGKTKFSFTFNNELTTDWKLYTADFTIPAEAEGLICEDLTVVNFNFGHLVGTAHIDRVIVCEASAEINPDGNLIADDESFAFNGGTTGNWKMQGWNNKGTATAVENGYNGSAYCMELAPNGTANQNYEAQVPNSSVATMERGKFYHISFMAKAETEGTEVEFGAQLSPWAAGNKEFQGNIATLTTDWAEYTFDLDVTSDYPAAGLNCVYFNFGKSASKVYIDHIVILETPAPEVNPENNMIADDASFGFEDGTTGKWNYLGWNNNGTFAVSAPGYGSEGCMALTSNKPEGDPWGAQLLCPLKEPVMRGGEYEITFWAKADIEGDFIAPGIAKAYPEPEWNTADPAELTTEWQKFTYTLVADETNTAEDGNSNFYFNHGKLQGTAYVDRVAVICTKEPVDAIEGVNVDGIRSINRVNLAGQAVGADFKGIVIEGNKKVLRK